MEFISQFDQTGRGMESGLGQSIEYKRGTSVYLVVVTTLIQWFRPYINLTVDEEGEEE